jgi:hypothetical protein
VSAYELRNEFIAPKYMYYLLRQMDKNIVNTKMYENVNTEMYLSTYHRQILLVKDRKSTMM